MTDILFSTRVLSAQEMLFAEKTRDSTAVESRIQFILARAENVENEGAAARSLLLIPYPELVRLFDMALAAAAPATRAALDALSREQHQERADDGGGGGGGDVDDIDPLFEDDLIC